MIRRLLLALVLAGLADPVRAQERPVRLVLNIELTVLDPHFTNSNATRAFGYLVFDTLISLDSHGEYRPQMLDHWSSSDDRLTWTFALRPGLLWSDGTPVTAADCVASIRRWGALDGFGRRLLAATKALSVQDDKTFTLELARPFGFVVEALGKPGANVPFMMPARLASTSTSQPIKEVVGSGPFIFQPDLWRPGERVVFRRNARYVPRNEPPDGLAGGKVPRVETVEIVSLPDLATKVAALQAGEVDFLEVVPLDYLASLARDKNVVLTRPPPIAQFMGGVQINNTLPPFDNKLARQALQAAVDQKEIVSALGLAPGMSVPFCGAIFMCGSPYETEAGDGPMRQASIERAHALLVQSGMQDQRTVVLHSTDSALINPMTLVLADRMKRAGFNIDLQSYDYATVAARRLKKEPLAQGGWSMVPVVWTGYDLLNPLSHYGTAYSCNGGYPGWYCIPEMQPLLDRFEAESDLARRRELAARMQVLVHENATILFTGQFSVPSGYRAELEGVMELGMPVMWNLRRKPGYIRGQ